MLSYNVSQTGDISVLKVDGKLDCLTVPEVRPEIDKFVERDVKKVILDASGIELLDSSGVAVIVSLFKRLRAVGGDVRIAALVGQPKSIFNLLRLDRALPVFPTVEEAIKGF